MLFSNASGRSYTVIIFKEPLRKKIQPSGVTFALRAIASSGIFYAQIGDSVLSSCFEFTPTNYLYRYVNFAKRFTKTVFSFF